MVATGSLLLLFLASSVESRRNRRHPWFTTPKPHLFPTPKGRPPALGTRVAAKAVALHVLLATALARSGMVKIITASNAAVHLCWYAAPLDKRAHDALDAHFLARSSLEAYDKRPWTMVLPCFSHKSREHFAGNMGFLQLTVPFLIQKFGRRRVAHLYSASCIGSSLVECFIPDVLRRFRLTKGSIFATGEVSAGLGASGALTALAVYACMSFPSATLDTSIPFLDPNVRTYPLCVCCLAMVAVDLYGLTRRNGEVREGDKEGTLIGHDAHIAGAAVGAALWLALVAPGRSARALSVLGAPQRRQYGRQHRWPLSGAVRATLHAALKAAKSVPPETAACLALLLWLLTAYGSTILRV